MERHGKGRRGLAAMDPEKAREIQRLGGQTAHRLGKAHKFTSEEAREAGKKGGRALSRLHARPVSPRQRSGPSPCVRAAWRCFARSPAARAS